MSEAELLVAIAMRSIWGGGGKEGARQRRGERVARAWRPGRRRGMQPAVSAPRQSASRRHDDGPRVRHVGGTAAGVERKGRETGAEGSMAKPTRQGEGRHGAHARTHRCLEKVALLEGELGGDLGALILELRSVMEAREGDKRVGHVERGGGVGGSPPSQATYQVHKADVPLLIDLRSQEGNAAC